MSSSDKSATAKLPQGKGGINGVLGICGNVRTVQLADGSLGNNDHVMLALAGGMFGQYVAPKSERRNSAA